LAQANSSLVFCEDPCMLRVPALLALAVCSLGLKTKTKLNGAQRCVFQAE